MVQVYKHFNENVRYSVYVFENLSSDMSFVVFQKMRLQNRDVNIFFTLKIFLAVPQYLLYI